jgi:hypothetical protein
VQEGIRHLDARTTQCQPPGGDVFVIAVHQSAVKIKQNGGCFGLGFLAVLRNLLLK